MCWPTSIRSPVRKKYLSLSYRFHDDFVMDSLAKQVDPMPGNIPIPMYPRPSARRGSMNSTRSFRQHDRGLLVHHGHHHSYVIGGNSNYANTAASPTSSTIASATIPARPAIPTTCSSSPATFWLAAMATFADYYERPSQSYILASQNPRNRHDVLFRAAADGTKKSLQRFLQHLYLLRGQRH